MSVLRFAMAPGAGPHTIDRRQLLRSAAAPFALRAALRTRLHGFFDGVGAPPLAEWRTTTKQHLPEYGR